MQPIYAYPSNQAQQQQQQGQVQGGGFLQTIFRGVQSGVQDYFGIQPQHHAHQRQDSFFQSAQMNPNSHKEIWERTVPSAPPMDEPPQYNENVIEIEMGKLHSPVDYNDGISELKQRKGKIEREESNVSRSSRGRGGVARARGRGRGGGRRAEQRAQNALQRENDIAAGIKPPPTEKDLKMQKLMARMPLNISTFFTLSLVLMVGVYVWEIIYNQAFDFPLANPWLWGSISPNSLIDCGGKYLPLIARGEWWRLFTSIFLHVSLPHLLMNIISQAKVGFSLERSYGAKRLIPIYLLSGIGGNIFSCILLPTTVSGGASGSLFGLYGILLVDLVKNWKTLAAPAKDFFVWLLTVAFSVAIGILPGIDNMSHIGGFIFGVVSGFLFLPSLKPTLDETKFKGKGRTLFVVFMAIVLILLLVITLVIMYTVVPYRNWCTICESVDCVRDWFGDWCGM